MSHPREPVSQTCPDIDKVIKSIRTIDKLCNVRKVDSADELKDIISDIESELWGIEDALECLRKSNDQLRKWGIEEARRVDEMENV